MPEAKIFNNLIIGQFVLTGVPVKIYTNGRFLTITDADDIEDPLIGFGMDEDGDMRHFEYQEVEFLQISGNKVDIKTYNKGMEAKFAPESDEEGKKDKEEKPEDSGKSDKLPKEGINMNLKNLMKEISADEVDAEIEGAEATIDAAKAKKKAADAAFKDAIKKGKDKIKAAKANLKVAEEGVVKEDHEEYTFGTGDIVKNINPKCKHFGSQGIVKKIVDDLDKGMIAIYTVTNLGKTYKPGDSLAKTVTQLAPIQADDNLPEDDIEEKLVYYKDDEKRLRRFDTDKSKNKKYED